MHQQTETLDAYAASDRRMSLRAPLIVQRVRLDDDRRTFFGYAKNVSRGGLFIGTTNPKGVGSRFLVDIPLPEPINRQVRCKCEVVWQRPWSSRGKLEPGMGLRFVDLPETAASEIDEWIRTSDGVRRVGAGQ